MRERQCPVDIDLPLAAVVYQVYCLACSYSFVYFSVFEAPSTLLITLLDIYSKVGERAWGHSFSVWETLGIGHPFPAWFFAVVTFLP